MTTSRGMRVHHLSKDGTCLPLFFLFFIFCHSVSQGQESDSVKYFCRARYEYFDVLRTSTERSGSIVFSRAGLCEVGRIWNDHTFLVSLSQYDEYVATNDTITEAFSSLKRSSYQLGMNWSSRFSIVSYSLNFALPLQKKANLQPTYGAGLELNLFLSRCIPYASYNKKICLLQGDMGLKDYLFPIEENVASDDWLYGVAIHPMDSVGITFQCTNNRFTSSQRKQGYSVVPSNIGDTYEGNIRARRGNYLFWIGGKRQDFSMNVNMSEDDVMFGDVAESFVHANTWFVGEESSFSWGSLGCEGGLLSISCEAVGHIESWPFTSLAAAVFSNRMNYVMNGSGIMFSLSLFSNFSAAGIQIKPMVDLYKIQPDFQIRHWEPQLLIFGVKNSITEVLPIESIFCMRVHLNVEFPVSSFHVGIEFEQYLPLDVRKRTSIEAGTAQTVVSKNAKSSTDGGRRIILSVNWN